MNKVKIMKGLLFLAVIIFFIDYGIVAQTLSDGAHMKSESTTAYSTSSQRINGSNMSAGIEWARDLSWDQIKEKAKRENKYIFLDCFATWCGPCKLMDKNVYINDTVGEFYNQRFISVKVQMDRTKNDNAHVQRWYNDAIDINKAFRIEAYPTFIYLSPEGVLVNKERGYKGVNDFISLAEIAVKPGRVYEDPYAEYDRLIEDYKKGVMHYDRMVYMVKVALDFDTANASKLIKTYTDHLSAITPGARYTKDNIQFWSLFIFSTESRTFQFFYKDGDKIDKVMNQKGYAAGMVDKAIMTEIVIPFLKEQNKNTSIGMSGMYVGGKGLKPDYSEADWSKLREILRKKFNGIVAGRNMLAARVEWYKRHRNAEAVVSYSLTQFKKYPPPPKKIEWRMNDIAWSAFEDINDFALINKVIRSATKVVKQTSNCFLLDSYANLLYKVGRKEEAISWEQKAIAMAKDPFAEGYRDILKQMNKGEPTYGVAPIIKK